MKTIEPVGKIIARAIRNEGEDKVKYVQCDNGDWYEFNRQPRDDYLKFTHGFWLGSLLVFLILLPFIFLTLVHVK
jgi:hypothetical protein